MLSELIGFWGRIRKRSSFVTDGKHTLPAPVAFAFTVLRFCPFEIGTEPVRSKKKTALECPATVELGDV